MSSRRSHLRRWCALTAPFHPYLCGPEEPPSAVCSLWHFPAGRPDWVLPSTLPCGVRTFLGRVPRGPARGHPADSPPSLLLPTAGVGCSAAADGAAVDGAAASGWALSS